MEILLNGKWKVGSDQKQWILYRKISKDRWVGFAFFTNLEGLCSALIELQLKRSLVQDIQTLTEEVKTLRKAVLHGRFREEIMRLTKMGEVV